MRIVDLAGINDARGDKQLYPSYHRALKRLLSARYDGKRSFGTCVAAMLDTVSILLNNVLIGALL